MLDSHEMSKTKHGGVLTWNLGTDDEDSSSVDPVNNKKKKIPTLTSISFGSCANESFLAFKHCLIFQ